MPTSWSRAIPQELITTTVTTTGFDRVLERIRLHQSARSPDKLQKAAMAGAELGAKILRHKMVMGPQTGTWYKGFPRRSSITNTDAKWTREYPAVQSGQLIDSIDAKPGRSTRYKGEAFLDASGEHAMWMEFGFQTKDGVVHYRPFMRTMTMQHEGELMAEMRSKLVK